MVTFWIFKALFLIYHSNVYAPFPAKEIFLVFLHGSRLDMSFSAYITLLPLLLLFLSSFFRPHLFKKLILWYTFILLPVIALISVADLEIFRWWGFRIDSSLFKYLKTPKEALASAAVSPVFLLVFLVIFFSVLICWLYSRGLDRKIDLPVPPGLLRSLLNALVLLLFVPLMFLLIRGGTQLAAINQSTVAFSNNQFLNQAAVNAPWNLVYSILEHHYSETNPFLYLPPEKAKALFDRLYDRKSAPVPSLVKGPGINVVLLIWESFTAKTVASLGGRQGITPGFEKLIHEGILFNRIYASGDRSDKGLVSILSGFPAQPVTSIMQKTNKIGNLPFVSASLRTSGYSTSFYYGGEPEFANIKSYLITGKFGKIISKENFPSETYNSKWGAHDEVVLQRLLKDLETEKEPFFASLFTLSSHEPFEVPMPPLLPGKNEPDLFLNSIHYTDSCIYSFIESAKKTSWWNNTLVIIIADHGHRLPNKETPEHKPDEFAIPMLWVGGALTKKDTVISMIGSQTDLARTLLDQLDIDSREFHFSKNLADTASLPFAYYAFQNGFGFLTPGGDLVFDNVSRSFILKDSLVTEEQVKNGQAYEQYSFQQYLDK